MLACPLICLSSSYLFVVLLISSSVASTLCCSFSSFGMLFQSLSRLTVHVAVSTLCYLSGYISLCFYLSVAVSHCLAVSLFVVSLLNSISFRRFNSIRLYSFHFISFHFIIPICFFFNCCCHWVPVSVQSVI